MTSFAFSAEGRRIEVGTWVQDVAGTVGRVYQVECGDFDEYMLWIEDVDGGHWVIEANSAWIVPPPLAKRRVARVFLHARRIDL